MLLKYRKGNKLKVLAPTKTLSAIVAEFESKKTNPEYVKIQSENSERIFKDRENIIKEPKFLIDKTLSKYIHDDEKWNNLWDKINEQGNEYINGIDRVIDTFKQFGLKDTEVRDELRELLQIGINEKITFEEIFDRYAKNPKFKGINYKKGDLDDFRTELTDLESAVKPWQTKEGIAKIKKIRAFHTTLAQVKLAIKAAQSEGKDFTKTPEFKAYQAEAKATDSIRREYIDGEIPVKIRRLNHLRTNVLNPIAKLLDGITALHVKVSVPTKFEDKYEKLISELPSISELPQDAKFSTLKSLVEGSKAPAESSKAPKKHTSVTASKVVTDKFAAVVKELDPKLGIGEFKKADMLKLVFRLYTMETLAKEGCLKKIPGSDGLVLTDLPKNFNAKDSTVIDLFATISSGKEMYEKPAEIKRLRERIDANAKVLARLNQVFGNDRALDKDFGWREKLTSLFTGDDTREISITMADIGSRKFSKPSKDFLNKYMSGGSETSYIIGKISNLENGVTSYNPDKLTKELNKRLNYGINNLFLNDEFKQIRENLFAKYKTKDKVKLYKILKQKVENFNDGLDAETIAVIRLGSVINQIIEANPEQKEIPFSASKEIRTIQKAAIKAGYPADQVKVIEDKILGALVVSPQGGFSASVAVNIDIGHGFTATFGLTGGPEGALLGVAISKTVDLGKGVKGTLGGHGGIGYVGGHANVDIPISSKVTMGIQGSAGISALGFYAGGGIGFMRKFDGEHAEEFKEELATKGFSKVEELQKQGKSPSEVLKELMKVPKYGPEFKAAKETCKMSPKALMEVYDKLRSEIDTNIKAKNSPGGVTFKFAGAGVAAGVVGPTAFVVPYVSFVINERRVGIRTEVVGQAQMDKASAGDLNSILLKELGAQAELTHETTGDTGQIAIGPDGKLAILEGKPQITSIAKFSEVAQIKEKLKEINVEISSKPKDGLNRLNVATDGDLKLIVDPTLSGIKFTTKGNNILFSGGNEALSGLTITREDFVYTNKKQGAQKLTIITIKTNPRRTRQQVEQESPYLIYQRPGFRPEIRDGIAERGSSNIKFHELVTDAAKGRIETIKTPDQKAFLESRGRMEKATNTVSSESFSGKPRPGLVKAVMKKFLKGKQIEPHKSNQQLYRELSTKNDRNTDNQDKLNQILSDIVGKTEFKSFKGPELALLHVDLIHESFIKAGDKMKTFEKHAKFARKVLSEQFKEVSKEISLTSSPEEMANQIINDIRDGLDFKDSKQKAALEDGAYMLSVVGTMKIKGLRGTSYLGSEAKKDSGIYNLKKYSPGDGGVKGDIGKAILQLQSPLDKTDNKKFMESKLARKIAAHDGLYLVLGQSDYNKVAECFKQKQVSPENEAAFKKFQEIVLKVREAQNSGSNHVNLPEDYRIMITTAVGAGAYEKCTNP
ncbi:MAG: hypothetical protein O3B47_04780, partial [bacterium]|nr:hypothetical protein [bacterium]